LQLMAKRFIIMYSLGTQKTLKGGAVE